MKWSNVFVLGNSYIHAQVYTLFFPTLANLVNLNDSFDQHRPTQSQVILYSDQLLKTIQISLAWTKTMHFKRFNNFHIVKPIQIVLTLFENIDI